MRCTEIDNFEGDLLLLYLDQNILWLQVTMRDLLAMAVGDCQEDLLDNRSSLFLVKTLHAENSIEQFLAITQLCHKVDLVFALIDFIEAQNVWVVQVFQDINLVHETHALLLAHAQFVDDFDGSELIVRT